MRAVLLALLAACSRPAPRNDPPPIPVATTIPSPLVLPKTAAEADDLVAGSRRRPSAFTPERTAYALERASHDLAHAHAGEEDIAGALAGGGYLLFGATHDSAAQVDAFRGVVTRIKGLGAIALEQLTTADDPDLDSFFRTGDDDARLRLRERQRSGDYAAWKFGYSAKIEDVLVAARGAGLPTLGCDMPADVRDALPRDLSDDALSGLRERHCAFALQSTPSAALLVGANHAERTGLPTFLAPEVRVRSIFFVGGRDPGFADPPGGLLALEPIMLQLDEQTNALLLPDAGDIVVSRFRDHHAAPNAPSGLVPLTLHVSSDVPVTFEVAGAKALVGPKGEWLSLRATRHVFAFRAEGVGRIGGVHIPLGGWTELHLGAHSLDMTEHEP